MTRNWWNPNLKKGRGGECRGETGKKGKKGRNRVGEWDGGKRRGGGIGIGERGGEGMGGDWE